MNTFSVPISTQKVVMDKVAIMTFTKAKVPMETFAKILFQKRNVCNMVGLSSGYKSFLRSPGNVNR